MTAYAWPFKCNRFEMRILPNTRTFTGPYTPTTQTLDLLGERLMVSLDIPPTTDARSGAQREAYFNRLKASANTITLGHQKLLLPQGSLRGSPTIASAITQLANMATITTTAGATLFAGDWIGFGGQLVQIMADTAADGSGAMPIEFQPRARTNIAAGAAVLWSAPTANFILKPGTPNVPTSWTPGMAGGATIELIEVF
jgi:hypothetical protein